jgi:hypothetical protein
MVVEKMIPSFERNIVIELAPHSSTGGFLIGAEDIWNSPQTEFVEPDDFPQIPLDSLLSCC